MDRNLIQEFVTLATGNLSYQEERKARFLSLGRRVAKQIALDLGLKPESYEVRCNPGGIAMSGEIWLHTDKMHLQFGQSSLGPLFLYRACNGRKDFTGRGNCWAPNTELLSNYENTLGCFRKIHGIRDADSYGNLMPLFGSRVSVRDQARPGALA